MAEEWIDVVFFRRLAHPLIPLLIRLKMSPNQVSTTSLVAGLLASWVVLEGYFGWGSLIAIAAVVLDCCDGGLARLTGKASPLGHILDGFFDICWITAFWLAIYFSGYFQRLEIKILPLMIAASSSYIIHCWRFDGMKVTYLEMVEPRESENPLYMSDVTSLVKNKWKSGRLFEAFIGCLMAFHLYFFVRGTKKKKNFDMIPEAKSVVRAKLAPLVKTMSWLGLSHHITLIVIGMILTPWSPYPLMSAFWIIFVPMNLVYFYCELRWRSSLARMRSDGVLPT